MKYNSGEEFLNKIYSSLHTSDIVEHTALPSDNPSKKIKRYMDRLDRVHNIANTKLKKSKVKRLYFDKYVIKRENLERFSKEKQDEIIEAQKNSLSSWIDYLTCEDAKFPMWAKYWAFQGMLKIGNYDEANDTYDKRSDKTISPFIEMNPEVLSKCISLIIEAVNGTKIDDEATEKLIHSGNFKKLYTVLMTKEKRERQLSSGFEGKWIKYNMGVEEDVQKLFDSLQCYGTGWCTAGSYDLARNQICGGGGYQGGDFYVYYTKNGANQYKIPRIAIRMNGSNEIGEIRGTDTSQNLEEGLENVVKVKLEEMSFLDSKSRKNNMLFVNNSRRITEINKKFNRKEKLNKEEILFLLDPNSKTFGFQQDHRIFKILDELVIDDYDLALELVGINGLILRYLSHDLKKKEQIILTALKQNGLSFQYLVEESKYNEEYVLCAVRQNGNALKYVPKNVRTNKNIVMEAVKQSGLALRHVQFDYTSYCKDDDIIAAAVGQDSAALAYVDYGLREDKDFMLKMVSKYEDALNYAAPALKKDEDIVIAAINKSPQSFMYVSPDLQKEKAIALLAVSKYGLNLCYVSENLQKDPDVVKDAVKQNVKSFNFVSSSLRNNINFIREMIGINESVIFEVPSEILMENEDLSYLYIKKSIEANPSYASDRKTMLEAIRLNPNAIDLISDKLKTDKKFMNEVEKILNKEENIIL